jgi:GDPmannose 4,6-dehydratase
MPSALIFGITGQDGSYLTEFLLNRGYQVDGVVRRSSSFNTSRLDHLYQDIHVGHPRLLLHYGDLQDGSSLRRIVQKTQPDEIYNLGAQSHVKVSFEQSEYTMDVVGLGTVRLLEAVREYAATGRGVRFYQAGSSEMFGSTPPPQSERSVFHPRSPYAAAKLAAHWHTVNQREAFGMFACNGILFNHESPRRGETFVTRKITRALTRIKLGLQERLHLGNLDARRDWGFAGDYVRAMWLMLQQEKPDDYAIGTGEAHTVREFLDVAAARLELCWQDVVSLDPRYLRPAEVDSLQADATKARKMLAWEPQVGFQELVHMMVDSDFELAHQERTLVKAGHKVSNAGAAYA